MANIEDILRKKKDRIEKIEPSSIERKKIIRTGPTRPWQENLSQYQTPKNSTEYDQASPKLERKYGESNEKVESELERKYGESNEKVERISPAANPSKLESREKVARKVESELERKYGESNEKVERKYSFSALIGLERKVTLFIFDQCQMMGSRVTSPISINHICDYCQTIVSSVKRTILTLQKKTIILRVEYKNGRGGWTKYSLADDIFSEILQTETSEKLRRNQRETREKVESQLESKVERAFSSSSSIHILEDLKTTTTSSEEISQLSPDWKAINFSSLLEQGIPFSETHLLQLAQRTKHTPKMIQDAIEHFAYDLRLNDKRASIKGDPIGFFMGIMQRGMYVAPSNFVDPAEAALDQYLAQQQAKLARMQDKLAQKESLDFELWLLETTEEQRREIAPHAKQDKSDMQKGILKDYWKASILKTSNA